MSRWAGPVRPWAVLAPGTVVGPRGRLPDGGRARSRADRRRRRARGRRRPPGRVEAGLRRASGRRDHGIVRRADGHRPRRHPARARTRPVAARRQRPPSRPSCGAGCGGSGPERDDDLDVLGRGARRRRRGAGHHARRVRTARAAAAGAGGRDGRHPQGHRQRLAAPRPSGRHHRPQHRPPPLRGAGHVRQVQPHGGRALSGHGPRRQPATRARWSSSSATSGSSATGTRSCRSSPIRRRRGTPDPERRRCRAVRGCRRPGWSRPVRSRSPR